MEHDIYLIMAIAGCTLVTIQLVLQLFGFVGDFDTDHGHAGFDAGADTDVHVDGGLHGDHAGSHVDSPDSPDGHGNLFFGVLSFKALTAFAGVFGLVGLSLEPTSVSTPGRVAISTGAGLLAMLAVGRLMYMLVQLHHSGTLDIRNAVGRTGTVYLRVPAKGEGQGKVTVVVQDRSVELAAVSDGEEIKTGSNVTVVAVEGNDVLRVVPA